MLSPRKSGSPLQILVLAIALLASCRGNATLPVAPQLENSAEASLFNLSIQAPQQSLAVGEDLQLAVVGTDESDGQVAVRPDWRSSDSGVATVDERGLVRGRQAGTVRISASTQTPPREATLDLVILAPGQSPPSSLPQGPAGMRPSPPGMAPPTPSTGTTLAIYPPTPRVQPGGRLRFLALQGPPGRETPAAVLWRSDNLEIATVDEAGVVTAIRPGTVRIWAQSSAYPAVSASVELAVLAPAPASAISGIRIRPERVVMNVGQSVWLQADVPTFAGGYDPRVRWESGDASVVTVSEEGKLTAIAPGTTTVSAVALGVSRGELAAKVPVEVRNTVLGRIRDILF
ncbi:MAG: Ig-like domain-containing protein [Candidatus Sericytochromatia bacterium]|nr:Ig-like domain-containing protein [Candidatus Sericytochromatia bacterium]